MKTRLLPIAALFAMIPVAHGADLMSVYRDAVAYDAQFAAARASLEAGREKLPQGRAGLLPTIVAGAQTNWNENDTKARVAGTGTVSREYNTNGWQVKLTQPLVNYANWVTYTQSELAVAVAESQYEQARMDLMVRSAQAYFDVLLAENAVNTAEAQKAAIAEQLASAKQNFEVGTATITDTHEAQARYDLAVAQEIQAQTALTVARYALQTLVGKPTVALKGVRPGVGLAVPQPNDMGKWVEIGDTGSPLVQVAEANLEIASREISKQRAGHYPTLNLVASSGQSAQSKYAIGSNSVVGPGADFDTNVVGLELTLPLFTGGYTSSKQRESISLKEKAQADLDNARRSTELGVRQAYLGVSNGLSQVKAFEAALISSQSSLESNKLGYEVGVRINIDVLNAQSQLYDTRYKLAKARHDTIMSLFKLKAAVGNLSDKDLEQVNSLLGD